MHVNPAATDQWEEEPTSSAILAEKKENKYPHVAFFAVTFIYDNQPTGNTSKG